MIASKKNLNSETVDPRLEFGEAAWDHALAEAKKYRLNLEPTGDGGFVGTSIEFPRVIAEGDSAENCVASLRRLIAVAIAMAGQAGRTVPSPTLGNKRDQQVNVRVTSEEKDRLLARARAAGYTGIGDYLRAVGLNAGDAAA